MLPSALCPLLDGGDRLLHQLVLQLFPLELLVDDVQQATLQGLIFQANEGEDLCDVVNVVVSEAAPGLALRPHVQVDDGLQLPLNVGVALSHVPDSEIRRVCKVVLQEHEFELFGEDSPRLLFLFLHLQIAN